MAPWHQAVLARRPINKQDCPSRTKILISKQRFLTHFEVRFTVVFFTEPLVKNMPKISGFSSLQTAQWSILGLEAMLGLRKSFGFAGAWTVHEQNRVPEACC